MADPILPRVAVGEVDAIEECLDFYGGLVWTLAKRSSANPTDAEDAVQEIFVEIWRQASRFDPSIASEPTFVAMIARRKLIDRYRRERRRPDFASADCQAVSIAVAPVACPMEISDEAARAREALASMDPEDRQFLEWSLCDGMSHAEVAGRSGRPLGTVKSKIRRGLLRLRELLSPEIQHGGVA